MDDQQYIQLLSRIKSRNASVGVVGLGYVGLPMAVAVAAAGFSVTGFDIDPSKMVLLDRGQSYINAVTDTMLATVARSGQFRHTLDVSQLSGCDVILICVPTPLTRNREPDLSFVESTARTIADFLTPETLVVLESTTYPGTTDEVLRPILASKGLVADRDFWVAFSPEREDPGNTQYSTKKIPKIVAGDSPKAHELCVAFYSSVVESVVPVSSTRTAEAVKITENVFRAVNIALVNELKIVYDALGIDIWEVIDGASTKPFGFMPFYPGPGLGGHCIPIDPFYLTWKAREVGLSTRFIELAGEINVNMPKYVLGRLRETLDLLAGKALSRSRILIVGLAYKKNISDTRESPSMRLMELLCESGAEVDYHDPHVPQIPRMREYPQFAGRSSVPAGLIGEARYDAILIATDHDAVDYANLASLDIPIVDTRNAFARRNLHSDRVIKS